MADCTCSRLTPKSVPYLTQTGHMLCKLALDLLDLPFECSIRWFAERALPLPAPFPQWESPPDIFPL
jgi:hypothetical protein